MFFTFPEDAHWNAEQQAVEFGVEIGSTAASSGFRGACSNAYSRSGPPASGASRRTTSNGPGLRVSPSESGADAN